MSIQSQNDALEHQVIAWREPPVARDVGGEYLCVRQLRMEYDRALGKQIVGCGETAVSVEVAGHNDRISLAARRDSVARGDIAAA